MFAAQCVRSGALDHSCLPQMDKLLQSARVVKIVDGAQTTHSVPIQQSSLSSLVRKRRRTTPSSADHAKTPTTSAAVAAESEAQLRAAAKRRRTVAARDISKSVSLDEAFEIKYARCIENENRVRDLQAQLRDIEHKIATFARGPRKVGQYNQLLDRRLAKRTEIVRAMRACDTVQQFMRRVVEFDKATAAMTAAADAHIALATSKSAVDTQKSSPDPDEATGTAATDAASSSHIDCIQFDADATVRRLPDVTFGAPIFDESVFARVLSLMHVDGDTTGPAPPETAERSGNALSDIDQLFDADARRLVVEAHTTRALSLSVLGYVVSNNTVGVHRGRTDADDDENDDMPISNAARESVARFLGSKRPRAATAAAAADTDDAAAPARKKKMVTMGQNREQRPMGAAMRNRINIKLKDIRNRRNTSALNWMTVTEDVPAEGVANAQRTVNFVRAIGERHCQQVEEEVHFDDPLCPTCHVPLEIDTRHGMETCPQCAVTTYMGIVREIQPLEQQTHNKYQYLKVGHMKTILKRCQGKETTRIPPYVTARVKEKLLQQGANLNDVDVARIKKTLRALGLSKWYDHRHKIHWQVTGRQPHQFSDFEEERFLAIFEHLVAPYEKCRNLSAENFPYYYYALHKIAQLLDYPPHVLAKFPLLQNKNKHRQKEHIWKNMMGHLGWPYLES